jgi:hypothetical protein
MSFQHVCLCGEVYELLVAVAGAGGLAESENAPQSEAETTAKDSVC